MLALPRPEWLAFNVFHQPPAVFFVEQNLHTHKNGARRVLVDNGTGNPHDQVGNGLGWCACGVDRQIDASDRHFRWLHVLQQRLRFGTKRMKIWIEGGHDGVYVPSFRRVG